MYLVTVVYFCTPITIIIHNVQVYFIIEWIKIFFPHLSRYVSSWIDKREVQSERANLQILFDKYVPVCLDTMRVRFKKITPISDISHLEMLCYLLECMLTPENIPPESPKELYELYFVFCCVWAFGGSLFQDQVRGVLVYWFYTCIWEKLLFI